MRVRCKNCGDMTSIGDNADGRREKLQFCVACFRNWLRYPPWKGRTAHDLGDEKREEIRRKFCSRPPRKP